MKGLTRNIAELGAPAVIAEIEPPIDPPEDSKKDDQQCKSNPKEKC
jgi:hypothetical protein